MKILIEIECETKHEAFQHLHEIRRQLKKEFQKNGKDDEIDFDFELNDNNCYGTHDVYGFFNEDVKLAFDVAEDAE